MQGYLTGAGSPFSPKIHRLDNYCGDPPNLTARCPINEGVPRGTKTGGRTAAFDGPADKGRKTNLIVPT